MSNVNNYGFAEMLKTFESNVLIPQRKKVADATKIMNDPNHQWKDDAQKNAGRKQLEMYQSYLNFYEQFYAEGLKICVQHENLTNTMSKVYDRWYSDISNEGKQEVELMPSQADLLCELFGEIYKELAPLNLGGVKPPHGMNL